MDAAAAGRPGHRQQTVLARLNCCTGSGLTMRYIACRCCTTSISGAKQGAALPNNAPRVSEFRWHRLVSHQKWCEMSTDAHGASTVPGYGGIVSQVRRCPRAQPPPYSWAARSAEILILMGFCALPLSILHGLEIREDSAVLEQKRSLHGKYSRLKWITNPRRAGRGDVPYLPGT